MNNRRGGLLWISLFLISLFLLPLNLHAEKIKIKVISEDASIRLKPDMTSDILENPPTGTVFEVEEKLGDWYKIKFSSKLGVRFTGYIHVIHVQVVKEEPEPKKKAILKEERPATEIEAQDISKPEIKKRINFKLGGFFTFEIDVYWHEFGFPFRNESFAIKDYKQGEESLGVLVGAGLFVTPKIEVTGDVAVLSKNAWNEFVIKVPSPFRINNSSEDDSGQDTKFKEMIGFLGVNYHPWVNAKLSPYFGIGGVYASGKFDMAEDYTYSETIDNVQLTHSVNITGINYTEKSLSMFGFFVRAGVDYRLFKDVVFFLGSGYTYAQKAIEYPLYENQWTDIYFGGFMIWAGIKVVL
jgi:hypothetical protein